MMNHGPLIYTLRDPASVCRKRRTRSCSASNSTRTGRLLQQTIPASPTLPDYRACADRTEPGFPPAGRKNTGTSGRSQVVLLSHEAEEESVEEVLNPSPSLRERGGVHRRREAGISRRGDCHRQLQDGGGKAPNEF